MKNYQETNHGQSKNNDEETAKYNLKLNNNTPKLIEEYKSLGVTINKEGNLTNEIRERTGKSRRLCKAIGYKFLGGKTVGYK